MTNLEKWHFYNKDLVSPDIFIDWAFYSMITSCLQRRVWTNNLTDPLFSSLFVFLCGPPGAGKGRIIKEYNKVLRHWKREDEVQEKPIGIPSVEEMIKKEKPTLIPIGPESVTFEKLVSIMSKNGRSFFYQTSQGIKKVFLHSSICFGLEELSSLLRKQTNDLVNFLLVAYDCGSYRYETMSRGEDRIHNMCLNLLAGTTPDFVKTIFDTSLIDQGFSSRSVFVYAGGNRFERLRGADRTSEQLQAYKEFLDHIKELGSVKGQCEFTKDAIDYLEYWWAHEAKGDKRINKAPKLDGYYSRKNITTQKLAMAVHYGEKTDMLVTLEEAKVALNVLSITEKPMHLAIKLRDKNINAASAEDLYNFLIKAGPQSEKAIMIEFYSAFKDGLDDLKKALNDLIKMGKLEFKNKLYSAIVNK